MAKKGPTTVKVSTTPVLNADFFGLQLDKFTQKVEMHLRQKIMHGFYLCFEEIVYRTPEDTTRAGTSWKLTVGGEADTDNQPSGKVYLMGDETTAKGAQWEYDYDVIDQYPSKNEVIEKGAKNLLKFKRRDYKKVATKQSKGGYRKQFTKFKTRGPIYITNSVSYIQRLEGGFSKQDKWFVKESHIKLKRFLESEWEGKNFGKDKQKRLDNTQYIKVKKEKTPLVGSSTLGLIGTNLPFKGSDGEKKIAYEDLTPPIELEDIPENFWKEIAKFYGKDSDGVPLKEKERAKREESGGQEGDLTLKGQQSKKHTWRPDEVLAGRKQDLLPGGGQTQGQARRSGQTSSGDLGGFWKPQQSGFGDDGSRKRSSQSGRTEKIRNVFQAWKLKQEAKRKTNDVTSGATGRLRRKGKPKNPTSGVKQGDGASGSTGRKRGSSSKKLASDLMEHKHAEFHSTQKKKGGKLAMKFDKVTDVHKKY